ncbi:hypothetical protein HZC34_01700 [Candidatus Saganbacteria bacterium]|nr:hypothetical protein [Candidatus Saganbacteria bacterium]
MTEKVIEKNKIKFVPIPEKIAKDVGLFAGSHVEITDDGYHIILTPKRFDDEGYSKEELDKIEKISKEKRGKIFKSGNDFVKYLNKISKK